MNAQGKLQDGAGEVGQRFGENLRRVRRREGLSQEELGASAGLHRTEVGILENRGRCCRIDTLVRLAGAMAVRPEELLDGIFWVPKPEVRGSFSFSRSKPHHGL
jgi:transcriptional regulator with XRE-family HTH domain